MRLALTLLALASLAVAACGPAPPASAPVRPSTVGSSASIASPTVQPRASTAAPASPTWPATADALVRPRPTAGPSLTGTIVSSDRGDITRLDLRGGRATRLTTDPADELDADLSPDGRLVAYRRGSGVGDQADIWVMNRDGSGQRNLTGDPSLDNWAPAWSPDGARLCFNSSRDGGTNRVWTMAADGSDLRLVTDGWGEYCDWSPDGTSIVYAAAGATGYDLWIRPLDGSSPTRLTSLSGTEFFPAWSPDGAWIAFEHVDEGVWLVHRDGSGARFLGEGGGIVWSPDGRLGFDRPGGFGLYDPSAGTLQRTALDIGAFPSWSR